MWYQLVLITNLGAVTNLATFDNQIDCLKQATMIPKTAQAAVVCLPTNSPEQLQKQFEANAKALINALNSLNAQGQK